MSPACHRNGSVRRASLMAAWRLPGWATPRPTTPPFTLPSATARAGRKSDRIASRESTAAATFMHASRLGRPLLWAEGGWLHLWYEAQAPGSGSVAIIHSRSTDGGRNWSQTHRLENDPLGGLSGARLGQTLLPLADGGVLLPLAGDNHDGPWLRLAATGQVVHKLARLPVANSAQAPQP